MPETILIHREHRVLIVTLNRPDKRNALNQSMVRELTAAFEEAGTDEETRVLVLEGAGPSFCAGADLEYLMTINENSPLENAADSRALMRMLYLLRTFPKPTIAKVHGPALAGGCGLALACDIIAASDAAQFGFTEVRIGFVPAIVAKLLVERVGMGAAREMLLRGNIITPDTAQDLGMINYVLSVEELDPSVEQLAREMAEKTSPQAVRLTKQLLVDIEKLDLAEAMEHAVMYNAVSRTTEDFRKGIGGFLKKEKPSW